VTDHQSLLDFLTALSQGGVQDDTFAHDFRHLFLQQSSATPDNLECLKQLIFVKKNHKGIGLKGGLLLTDIIHSAEGCEIPQQVLDSYPELTQAQWDASLRFITILLTIFESKEDI